MHSHFSAVKSDSLLMLLGNTILEGVKYLLFSVFSNYNMLHIVFMNELFLTFFSEDRTRPVPTNSQYEQM